MARLKNVLLFFILIIKRLCITLQGVYEVQSNIECGRTLINLV